MSASRVHDLERAQRHNRVRRVVRRWVHQTMLIGWRSWTHYTSNKRLTETRQQTLVRRWRNMTLSGAFQGWSAKTRRASRARKRVIRTVRKWRQTNLSIGWWYWRMFLSTDQARQVLENHVGNNLELNQKFIRRRLRRRRIQIVFFAWYAYCAQMTRKKDCISGKLEQRTHEQVHKMLSKSSFADDISEVFFIAVAGDDSIVYAASCKRIDKEGKEGVGHTDSRRVEDLARDRERIMSPTASSLLRTINRHLEPQKKQTHPPRKAWT